MPLSVIYDTLGLCTANITHYYYYLWQTVEPGRGNEPGYVLMPEQHRGISNVNIEM